MSLEPYNQDVQCAARSAAWIARQWGRQPQFAIVLGTGAGDVAKTIEADYVFHYREIPEFPISTAIGHSGTLVCGMLGGVPVVAMKGRFHLYEGYSVERATHGIRMMHQLGARHLIVTNAAGGINPRFVSGDVMLISSHLDLMFRPAQARQNWHFERTPQWRCDQAYDLDLMEQAEHCARVADFPLYRGIYVGMLGPQYETRAEYRALRKLGGDAVGMSTIPEVCVAKDLGMRVLGLSVIANVANPDALVPTSGQEVIEFADIAAPKLKRIVEHAVQSASTSSLG